MDDEQKKLVTSTGEPIGYNYQFQADLGSGKGISITGVLPVNANNDVINGEFDKIRASLDRQVAKSAVPAIAHELDGIDRQIKGLTEDLELAEKRFAGKKIPDNEAAAHHNIKTTLRNLADKRKSVNEMLLRTQKEAE